MSIMESQTIVVRRTFKYRLYHHRRKNKHLHQSINVAGLIWNHALALQKRYYRLTGRYIGEKRMKKHLKHLRMKTKKYAFWKAVGSQAVQDIVERLERAYQRAFKKQGGFPKFKQVKKYKSFTLKQTAGWKLFPDVRPVQDKDPKLGLKQKRGVGCIRIGGRIYKFVKHRELRGKIKTVTIKRDSCGRLWVCFSVIDEIKLPDPEEVSTGENGGFDFGLVTFLTDHTGEKYCAPEFFKQELSRVRSLSKSISRKVKGSHNRKKTRYLLNRTHIRVEDQRRDFHFKLAHELCKKYDILVFEDLNITAMKKLWGRKVSDLAFAQFVEIVTWVAKKQGKQVIEIDRFEPTTQTCSACDHRQTMHLKDRVFDCQACDLVLDRDHNAARNILRWGISAH